MKIDFHVHTDASTDSNIRPAKLAKKADALGIIPAITDHNSVESWKKMKAARAPFIPGEEIRTDIGDLIGLFLTEKIEKKLSFEETVDRIREQGGLVYLPHMYDHTRMGCGDKYASLVDIIEIFNGRCVENMNERAEKTAKKLNKAGVAGSDSHFLFEFGNVYTELGDFDIESPKSLLKALKNQKKILIKKSKSNYWLWGFNYILSKTRRIRRGLKERIWRSE